MAPPGSGWIPFIKLLFGFALLAALAVLAAIMALGKVKAADSFGLDIVLGGLLTLSGGFAGWAFQHSHTHQARPPESESLEEPTHNADA
jgi:hypothetical protein